MSSTTQGGAISARGLATQVLLRVADQGAYASAALDAELGRAKLADRDAALATDIVYGSLRVLPELDSVIAAHVTRDIAQMDPFVHAALRAAAYQLAHLGRMPTHAIVDETVTLVRTKRGPKLGGFVNAVLRKLATTRPSDPNPPRKLAVPPWFARTLRDALGAERTQYMLGERGAPPATCLRIEPERTSREALIEQLRAATPHALIEAATLSPLGVLVRRAGSPRTFAGYNDGLLSVQEEGAQLIALGLGVQPGERIADVCAGHGGKTTLFARQVGATGHVTAIDVDERKLERIAPELQRLGIARERVDVQAIDVSVGTGGLPASYDRVLVDAPCTGLGTIDRRPEILLRTSAEDPARLAELQLRILRQALRLVRPGGVLAYSVCSPTKQEGVELALRFEALEPRVTRELVLAADLPPLDADGVLRVGPWLALAAQPLADGAPPPGDVLTSRPDAYQLIRWRVA